MQEYFIDSHHPNCQPDPDRWTAKICEMNPRRFLFRLKGEYYLIHYHNCITNHDTYGFKKSLVEQVLNLICKKSRTLGLYEVNKSVCVDKELKELRLRNKALRKTVHEINYIYADNAGKMYAITTAIPFMDWVASEPKDYENFEVAMKFLDERHSHLKDQLKDLHNYNNFGRYTEPANIVKSIDHLIKSIQNADN